ncbi:MAG: YdbH domain-containing protein [Gammaproteobacteria bacterium]|nr:YdbH domain-containing protein [Gammaproteobacteria bacterium]
MAKIVRRRRLYWILASVILSLLLGFWLIFTYRLVLIKSTVNYFGRQHQLEIISLAGLHFSAGQVQLASLHLRLKKSQLLLSDVSLILTPDYWPQAINIAQARVTLDIDSIAWLQRQQSASPKSSGLFDFSQLPALELAELQLELTNFPAPWQDPALSDIKLKNITLKNTKLSAGNQLKLSAALWLNQQPIFKLNGYYNKQGLDASITADLAQLLPLVGTRERYRQLLPPQAQLRGQANVELNWLVEQPKHIQIATTFDELSLVAGELLMAQGITVRANTSLNWDAGLLLNPIDIELKQEQPLNLKQAQCQQWLDWLGQTADWCQQLAISGQLSISLAQAAQLQLQVAPYNPTDWQLTNEAVALNITTADTQLALNLSNSQLSATHMSSNWQLKGLSSAVTGIKSVKVTAAGILSKHAKLTLQVEQAKVSLSRVKLAQAEVKQLQLTSKVPFEVIVADGDILSFKSRWHSFISELDYRDISLPVINSDHRLNFSPKKITIDSWWRSDQITLTSRDHIHLNDYRPTAVAGRWKLPQQAVRPLVALKPALIELWPPELVLTAKVDQIFNYQGKFNRGMLRLNANVQGHLMVEQGSYQELYLTQLGAKWQCQFKANRQFSADCAIDVTLAALDVGLALSNLELKAKLSQKNQQTKLEILSSAGELLGGTLDFGEIDLSNLDEIDATLTLKNISLAALVELQQQSGITVTGRLNGKLPMRIVNNKVSISGGRLANDASGGVIQIKDNQAVNQLRLSQPQLEFVWDALENLHYSELSSDIDYKADGSAIIKVAIRGRNPAFERSIEFNYSHQENILQLLRSLRIGDEISQQIEKIAQ